MKDVVEYWLHGYDWLAAQDGLNRFPQFKARIGDLDIPRGWYVDIDPVEVL